MVSGDILHLRAAGTSLLLDCRPPGLPRIVHWGADLGELGADELLGVVAAQLAPTASGTLDDPVPLALLPEAAAGWLGTPGLTAHRQGRDFSTSFVVQDIARRDTSTGADQVVVRARDAHAGVDLELNLEMHPSGLIRQRATVTNSHTEELTVDGLVLALPVPPPAQEILDLTGRHLRERGPQRHAFTVGNHLRESRGGRPGLDATLLHLAGEEGFGFRHGEVWGVHVGWSGNQRSYAEATPSGRRLLGGGELLLPGEIVLAEGASYASPWVYASYGVGFDELSARFHQFLRARPAHPTGARPVTLNTWEAVYFDHDLDKLTRLADRAAEVGVERFVLDDGWFRGRRHDRAGLGDWFVDDDVWPAGLAPLIDHVLAAGMEFGLWVEPEMINEDSDLARAHPDWILGAGDRMPPAARHQQVLDLTEPAAYDYLLDRLDHLLGDHPISYLKWDHNRDLVEPGSRASGRAAAHDQTLALYRLLDELRRRHPQVEIESCASGGGRIDLAILERTDRVWTSDCIDPLERQQIQRWTGLLLPPELMGAHVGSPTAHTTGRTHTLDFRAGTAFFGHFGIEWDLTTAAAEDLARLATWVAAHQELRSLLHTGKVVHGDQPGPAQWLHGVVAQDGSQGVFAVVQMATGVSAPPGAVRLPGLDPDTTYDVRPLPPGDLARANGPRPPAWWDSGVTLSGQVLGVAGVQSPALHPEQVVLIEARATTRHSPAR